MQEPSTQVIGVSVAKSPFVRVAVIQVTEMLRVAPMAAMSGRTAAWQSRVQGRLRAGSAGSVYQCEGRESPAHQTSRNRSLTSRYPGKIRTIAASNEAHVIVALFPAIPW